jgi:hypothetical protein
MERGRSGLTVVEVLFAVVVLTVGLLALISSWAPAARMLGQGRRSTLSAQVAAARMATLRHIARSTVPPCTSPEWRDGEEATPGFIERWRILEGTGPARRLELSVETRTPAGWTADTVMSAVLCTP